MANIRTIITLVDNMSPTLKRINTALGITTAKLVGVQAAISIFRTVSNVIKGAANEVNELTDAYAAQYESEVKLYTIMRQRMNATVSQFNEVKNLTQEMEKYGVLSDKVILKGSQELASFVKTEEQIKTLIPAIANLTVQQYGYNASADQMRQITTSIGKMLNGTVSGLSKLGLAFTDEEKKMLKSNDMGRKVEIVLTRINEKVGDMNRAMGLTNIGKIQNLKNRIESVNEELGRLLQPLRIVGLEIALAFKTTILNVFGRMLQWINQHAKTLSNTIIILSSVALTFMVVKLVHIATKLKTIFVMQGLIHWKSTLIMAGIILIIALLAKMGVPLNKILGVVIGGITYVMTVLRNLVAFVWNNVVVPIYNAVARVVEMIGNLLQGDFISLLKKVAAWILDIFLVPIKAIGGLIDGIISLFGGKANTITNAIQEAQDKVYDWAHPEGSFKVERLSTMEYKSPVEKANETYSKTADAVGKIGGYIKDATSGFQLDIPEVDTLNGAMAVYDKDLINIAEDYRELLSKRAVEKFNLQLARISPSVTIEKVDVHREADAENVLDTVVRAIEDFSNSSLSVGGGRINGN